MQALAAECSICKDMGGGIPCARPDCTNQYHFPCALANDCRRDVSHGVMEPDRHVGCLDELKV